MDHNKIIDAIGGTTVTADLCEVAPQAVSQWRRTGIPRARLMYLRLARPKIFRALAQREAAAPTENISVLADVSR